MKIEWVILTKHAIISGKINSNLVRSRTDRIKIKEMGVLVDE